MVIGIVSGKGGTGKTMLTAGIADSLAKSGKKVLAVGCRYGDDLDLALDCSDKCLFSFSDLATRVEGSFKRAVVKNEHCHVCAPPKSRDFCFSTSIQTVLCHRDEYDYIILDDPQELDLLDCVIIITTPEQGNVRAASDVGISCRLKEKKCLLVLNKLPIIEGEASDVSSIIDSTYSPLIGALPFTYNCTKKEKAELYRVIYSNIAARLEGAELPLFSGLKNHKKMRSLIE